MYKHGGKALLWAIGLLTVIGLVMMSTSYQVIPQADNNQSNTNCEEADQCDPSACEVEVCDEESISVEKDTETLGQTVEEQDNSSNIDTTPSKPDYEPDPWETDTNTKPSQDDCGTDNRGGG